MSSGNSTSSPGIYSANFKANTIERAILLEDIILPDFPPFPTHDEIKAGNVYYPRPEELYEDTLGKFSIPILTPLNDNEGDPTNKKVSAKARNIVNSDCHLEVSGYNSSNYIELWIPKYILLNFIAKVPAGQVFIVAFVGGEADASEIKVIGVG